MMLAARPTVRSGACGSLLVMVEQMTIEEEPAGDGRRACRPTARAAGEAAAAVECPG